MKKKNEDFKTASEIMTDITEQEPDDKLQSESYEGYLGIESEKSDELAEIEQAASVNDDFEALDDTELEVLYEEALSVPVDMRNENQSALLEQTKERYLRIKFYRQFEDAAKWFETEYDDKNFEEIVTSDGFLRFASGVKLPIRELIRRYMEMYEKNEAYLGAKGPGSASNVGATAGKDYFSRAEVEKMSAEEVSKNLEIIKKSMKKWK